MRGERVKSERERVKSERERVKSERERVKRRGARSVDNWGCSQTSMTSPPSFSEQLQDMKSLKASTNSLLPSPLNAYTDNPSLLIQFTAWLPQSYRCLGLVPGHAWDGRNVNSEKQR
ncbi:hypothetical protein Pcinc_042195 [Petrolisthes cinctipes]|uniref:Uncharacterized protein n=1 Tax=Petrolisthes cinctipes TaxID=88211 RepID=A0AAE1BI44_PETCI|nr:hypothetical protein Pcinc_042195 [Petrolisthes cinctipes]